MKRKTYYNIDTFPCVVRLFTDPEREVHLLGAFLLGKILLYHKQSGKAWQVQTL
jgi:hypothetical protein